MDIHEKLNRYADLKDQADVIRLRFDDLRKQLTPEIPPEIQEQLDDLAAEEKTATDALQNGLTTLEAEIKAEVASMGVTVKTEHFQAVYMKGRISWDTKALEGYAAAHPEIVPFRKQGEPSVSLRAV